MATKATPKKSSTKATKKKTAVKKKPTPASVESVEAVEAVTTPVERYVYGVGRRKTAVAQVRLYATTKAEETKVNNRPIRQYFGTAALETRALSPLKIVGLENVFTVTILAQGGGLHGQADAAKLGIARALLKHDALLRPVLKAGGFLTRDSRAVERKKPGLKKARRSPQWAKR